MAQQKRIDDAVFEIDAHLLQIRETINVHRIKTHDDELLKIIELINMSRGGGRTAAESTWATVHIYYVPCAGHQPPIQRDKRIIETHSGGYRRTTKRLGS